MCGLAFGRAEGGKIVFAQQRLRRLVHCLCIQRPTLPAQQLTAQGRTHRAVEDAVAVTPRPRRKARMEIGTDRLAPAHSHFRWQPGGRTQGPGTRVAHGLGIKVHHLALAMDTGIGAPGAHHAHRDIGHRGQRLFQCRLHARATLAQKLPTLEGAAVVFDSCRVTHQQRPLKTAGTQPRRPSNSTA